MAAADQPATRNQSSPSVSESQELPVQEQGGDIHNQPVSRQETAENTPHGELVTGPLHRNPSSGASHSYISTTESKQHVLKQYKKWCIVVLTYTVLIIFAGGAVAMTVLGGKEFQKHDNSVVNLTKYIQLYENDTVLLGNVNSEDKSVVIIHQCSDDSLDVDLYLAPNCELKQYVNRFNYGPKFINSKGKAEPVPFAWGSEHIYLPLNSSLTFIVQLTHGDPVLLVGFNNYTYYLDYLHLRNPPTDKACLIHRFNESSGSSFTFTSLEENTYYFALESNAGTNYSFSYSGRVYIYNYTDYRKSQCNLAAEVCDKMQCSFNEKVCILGHIQPAFSSQTFANILTNTSQINSKSRIPGRNLIISGGSIFIGVVVICVIFVCLQTTIHRVGRTSPESQPLLRNGHLN